MSGESESSDSDNSKIITSDEEGEFLEEIKQIQKIKERTIKTT